MKKLIFALACVLSLSTQKAAAVIDNMVGQDALIDGVGEFLKERAEANMLYIFERRIKENENFQCYFPNTYKQLQDATLQEWMIYPGKIWQNTLRKDFEIYTVRALITSIEGDYKVSKQAEEIANKWYEMASELALDFNGEHLPLTSVFINRNAPESIAVNGFSNGLGNIVVALNNFRPYTSICDSPAATLDQFKAEIEGLLKIKDNLAALKQHFDTYGKDLRLNTDDIQAFCARHDFKGPCSTEAEALKLVRERFQEMIFERYAKPVLDNFIKRIEDIQQSIDTAKLRESFTAMILDVTGKIKARAEMTPVDYKKLRRIALFFANISDAQSKEEVAAILKAYTLPAVSYYVKREEGRHLNITAYLGLAQGYYDDDQVKPDQTFSLFAPIGLEGSIGLSSGGSVSAMLAPFDFGYPVHQNLNGNDEDSKLVDVFAPSITLSYGFKDMPFTVGGGYQQGRHNPILNQQEDRWLLFMAFDMPLFSIK